MLSSSPPLSKAPLSAASAKRIQPRQSANPPPVTPPTSLLRAAPPARKLEVMQVGSTQAITPRQRQVLYCLAEGKPTKLICEELRMSEGTVKVHIGAIFRAMRVHNRTQATLVALRDGCIHPEMWSRS
ncbi:MAG: response regulator transcription factor [Burkholderiaceae bacterium]